MANNNITKYFIAMILIFCASKMYSIDVNEDKTSIVKCYQSNIEYFKLNPHIQDHLNFYVPYSKEHNNVISVDTIIYKPDSLMAVAFVVINDTLKNYYDAKAIICYRKNINECFQIYPSDVFGIIHFESPNKALSIIKEYYFNELKKQCDQWRFDYKYNVDDPEFWDNSLYFKKINGKYYFELYYKLNNFEIGYEELNYVRCNCK